MSIIPSAEGVFYPDDKISLINLLDQINIIKPKYASELIIVPHAGYEFCADILLNAYSYFSKYTKEIMIIAPAIYNSVYGTVTADDSHFETPLGAVNIIPHKTKIDNKILSQETALTVQLPIIKYLFPNASVIPIVYGCENYKNISEVISKNIKKTPIAVVTNLSRFIPEKQCLKLDEHTSELIANKRTDDIDIELADGAIGICGVIDYIKNKNLYLNEIEKSNSAKINGDTSHVVGYGSWVLATQ